MKTCQGMQLSRVDKSGAAVEVAWWWGRERMFVGTYYQLAVLRIFGIHSTPHIQNRIFQGKVVLTSVAAWLPTAARWNTRASDRGRMGRTQPGNPSDRTKKGSTLYAGTPRRHQGMPNKARPESQGLAWFHRGPAHSDEHTMHACAVRAWAKALLLLACMCMQLAFAIAFLGYIEFVPDMTSVCTSFWRRLPFVHRCTAE